MPQFRAIAIICVYNPAINNLIFSTDELWQTLSPHNYNNILTRQLAAVEDAFNQVQLANEWQRLQQTILPPTATISHQQRLCH
jgi:hypothetical protein